MLLFLPQLFRRWISPLETTFNRWWPYMESTQVVIVRFSMWKLSMEILFSCKSYCTLLVLSFIRFHRKDVLDLQWSADSAYLISGSVDNSCIIWDVNKGNNDRQILLRYLSPPVEVSTYTHIHTEPEFALCSSKTWFHRYIYPVYSIENQLPPMN